jgi:predicted nucleic acid-binding protein
LRAGATLVKRRLEEGIESTTVVPVTDALLSEVAQFRFACRQVGHPLADRIHANDLWVAASALHIEAPLVTADGVFADAPGLTLLR